MKFITAICEGNEEVLVQRKSDGQYCRIADLGFAGMSMNDVVVKGLDKDIAEILSNAADIKGYTQEQLTLCAPIPVPMQDVVCLGINYAKHMDEAVEYKKEAFNRDAMWPIYFSKRVNRAVADGEKVKSHAGLVENLDYENELAVILGKDACNVPKEKVSEYVFGYTIINDITARDLQTRHKQWYFGKSLDTATPMGPCIVTKDEFAYPPKMNVKTWVNGELRQDSTTELLIFDIDHIVSELTQGMTLKAGTIISTGTPAGVGMGFKPPKFLKHGDVIRCEIEGIGTLTNEVN